MTPKEANDRLWKIEYTAMVNQLYYEKLTDRFKVGEALVRITVIGTAVVGGVCGLLELFGAGPGIGRVAVAIGVVSIAIAILVDMFAVSKYVRYSEELRDRWSELRGRSEKLCVTIDSDGPDKLSAKSIEELKLLIDAKTEIDKSERLHSFDGLHIKCQRQINKQTWLPNDGTYADVMKKRGLTTAA